MYHKCELNITLKCNLRCTNCNRCPNLFTQEDTDVTPSQIDYFIEQIKGKGVSTIKVLGGEPLLNPYFTEIYSKLTKAIDNGIFKFLKIDHNHTQVNPITESNPNVRWMGKSPRKKKHLPVLWSPLDMGYTIKPNPNCQSITRCGQSYDSKGFLPCSPAIAIVKIFKLNHLYKKDWQLEPWGLDEICKHCVMAMSQEWCNEHLYPINMTPKEALIPTKSYKEMLNGRE